MEQTRKKNHLGKFRTILPALALATLAGASLLALSYVSFEETRADPAPFTTNINFTERTIAETDDPPELAENQLASVWTAARDLYINLRMALERSPAYISLASPSGRYVKIIEGMRREEIADSLAAQLGWSKSERDTFLKNSKHLEPVIREGRHFPSVYLIPRGASHKDIRTAITEKFRAQVEERYSAELAKNVPLETALRVAAIIQREAGGKDDMRYISGIIWNRIFKDMNLQIDATLQYAKGSETNGWWPDVVPNDKFIDSPFNTYQNKGLTPMPIANPGTAAVAAALNPRKTECLFYFHDRRGRFYCSKTYEGHVAKLKSVYGTGK